MLSKLSAEYEESLMVDHQAEIEMEGRTEKRSRVDDVHEAVKEEGEKVDL